MELLYIARQPIVDRQSTVVGYELLFRGNQPDEEVDARSAMTASAINNLINVIGIDTVLGNRLGFIKITPLFITRKLIEALPRERLVFTLFEEDLQNSELIEAIGRYREAGYLFGVNDIKDPRTLQLPGLLQSVNYLKLDYEALPSSAMEQIVTVARHHGLTTVAAKIETRKAHKEAMAAGCDLFQGFFFQEPEILEEQPVQAEAGAILRLWNLVRNNASVDELVEAFEQEHAITLQLLRFINSPYFSLRQTVTSIRHLITLLGHNQLAQWLLVMLFAKETQKEGGNHPLLLMVVNRTELMVGLLRLIEPDAPKSKEETAYLVGMLSLIHLIFQRPHREILHHLHVSEEIEEALFEANGFYGELLKMVRVIENNEVDRMGRIVKKYRLAPDALNHLLIETMKKVNAFDEALKHLES